MSSLAYFFQLQSIYMPNKTKFPRSTIKQLIRTYQPKDKKRISNNADILVRKSFSNTNDIDLLGVCAIFKATCFGIPFVGN